MSNHQTQQKRQAIITNSSTLLKTLSKYALLMLGGFIIHQAQAFPILISGDASKNTNVNLQSQPIQKTENIKPTSIKLTEDQRKQKIYDLSVLFFSRDKKEIKSIDIENFKVDYRRDINSCDTKDCQKTQTNCSDTFTRNKKADSVELDLPEGLQPLYYDERVCHTTKYIP